MSSIYISSVKGDRPTADLVSAHLSAQGHRIISDTSDVMPGENILDKLGDKIRSADIIIVIITRRSADQNGSQEEYGFISFSGMSGDGKSVINLLLEYVPIPPFLSRFPVVDMTADIAAGWFELDALVKSYARPKKLSKNVMQSANARPDYRRQIEELRTSLQQGRLTLVCGAGVSVDATVPDWSALLTDLLAQALSQIVRDHPRDGRKLLTGDFEKKYSNLIMGKYLKMNLGSDFQARVKEAIYRNNPTSGEIIKSIIRLARPQRGRATIESIITFNFDDLLEKNLSEESIKYRTVFEEGIRPASDELPIYHVHGYLPREGMESQPNIVFSEDTYHTQFIDPFSWSNLTQLNKLSSNNCLLVGISLSDPNLRRLLDVASRKSPENERNHYLIKRVPKGEDAKVDEIALLLEEQDANGLGLNMIWVQEFTEIPKILDAISTS